MLIEWLEDYRAKENEKYNRFEKGLQEGKYPPENLPFGESFQNISRPAALLSPSNIWAQIPFYKTAILNLIPLPKTQFFSYYDIKSDGEFQKLIDLAKMGRIKFMLGSDPTYYARFDYLVPILDEFRPPMNFTTGANLLDSDSNVQHYYHEFFEVGDIGFIPYIRSAYSEFSTRSHANKRISEYATIYAVLKALKYEEIADGLLNIMVDNPLSATGYLSIARDFITNRFTDLLTMGYNPIINKNRELFKWSLDQFANYPIAAKEQSNNMVFPNEIGSFILNKLTFLPQGYEACMAVIDRYDQNDLYTLMDALQNACTKQKFDVLTSKSQEISTVLDNLWKDANKISSFRKGMEYGFPISLAVAGAVLTPQIAGTGGLLAGLGIKVMEKTLKPITNKFAQIFFPDYLITIHDFKNTYKIIK